MTVRRLNDGRVPGDDLMLTMELVIEYGGEEDAEAVYRASNPDDDDYVATRLEGCKVVIDFKAETAGAMRSAMDDVLACVKVSEAASGLVSETRPDLDGDPLLE